MFFMEKYEVLKKVFGYDSFREFQEESIDALLKRRDLLTILPTGAGKSLCYQLPSLMMDGVTIVISPLIALMQDQVRGLSENGISAKTINSDMSEEQRVEVFGALRSKKVKLLYVAPERMILPEFIHFLKDLDINFFVVDEAHCVSEWGHEFRSDYRELYKIKENFPDIPVAAFTATATPIVAQDISKALHLNDPLSLRGGVFRENLLIKSENRVQNGRSRVLEFLQNHSGECGIIYTFTRKESEELARFLQSKNISARAYHAGIDKEEKASVFHDFLYDKLDIVVATIAFGMGIDKSNIRFVIHTSLPKTIESYYQEIGRAGRDGLQSETLLLYSKADEIQKRELIYNTPDPKYQEVLEDKLQKMYRFAQSSSCKHKLLSVYFGDKSDECKDKCDSCLKEPVEQKDITKEARMFLSTIYRTGSKFGQNHLIDVLRGSKSAKILQFGHEKLSVYGIGDKYSKQIWSVVVDKLFDDEALMIGEHRSICMSEIGVEILKGDREVSIDEDKMIHKTFKKERESDYDDAPKDETFEALRKLRSTIAHEASVPAYIVFSDKTLRELSSYLPQDKAHMLAINGIGEVKYERYGEQFLDLCKELAKADK
jgi:ATP-dependent DNA helicase RecQ